MPTTKAEGTLEKLRTSTPAIQQIIQDLSSTGLFNKHKVPISNMQQIIAYLSDAELILHRTSFNQDLHLRINNPAIQEILRQYAIENPNLKVKLSPLQKKHLSSDVLTLRVRKGEVTTSDALRYSSQAALDSFPPQQFPPQDPQTLIELGFSSLDIPINLPLQHYHILHAAIMKAYLPILDKELKESQETLSITELRATKLEAYFKAIKLFSFHQADLLLLGCSLQYVVALEAKNLKPKHIKVLTTAKEQNKNDPTFNLETYFDSIKNFTNAQLEALENPLGFTKDWIQSEFFSLERYILVRNHKWRADKVRTLTTLQVSLLLTGKVTLAEISTFEIEQIHVTAIQKGFSFQTIKLLAPYRIAAAVEHNLPLSKVSGQWFTPNHSKALLLAFTYETIENLTGLQLQGVMNGLTRAQVLPPWFQYEHLIAVQAGLAYEVIRRRSITEVNNLNIYARQFTPIILHASHTSLNTAVKLNLSHQKIKNLTELQLQGVMAGLSPEQVTHSWFQHEHLMAIQTGFMYEKIAEKSTEEVNELRIANANQYIDLSRRWTPGYTNTPLTINGDRSTTTTPHPSAGQPKLNLKS